MSNLRRMLSAVAVTVLALGGVGLAATAASASTPTFSSQSATILQGVPATGNQVTLTGSNLPASFDSSTATLTFSEAGLEGYVDSATATSITMSVQVEPWVPTGSASVTVAGSDGSTATCTNCLSVTGSSPGWAFYPPANSEPNPRGGSDELAVWLPATVCPLVSGEPEGCGPDTSQTTLYLDTPANLQILLGDTASEEVEPGATINVYGAPGQFVVGQQSGNDVAVTAESTAASALAVDPNLTAIVVRNPDGTVAICSDCVAVGSSVPTSNTFYAGYSFDPSPIVQFGNQLLVNGTLTCSTQTAMWVVYSLTQGALSENGARWVDCEGANYVSMAFPVSDFEPGSISLEVIAQGYDPLTTSTGAQGVDVNTTATYSLPLLIGVTLDSTGYRGPGEAIFGATVSCNQPVSGTASVAFTLDGATVDASAPATCGSNGLGYVVFNVPGPWSSGPAGVSASFSADDNTGTTTGVVNIS